jgi:phage tail protein X
MQIYRTTDGDMLDLIAWAAYGVQSGATEALIEANPHVIDIGLVFPSGIEINLPDLDPQPVAQPTRLWD